MAVEHPHASTQEVEEHIAGPRRVLSVDLLRGLAVAFMILVNNPGDWDHVLGPLDHSEWNGWHLADLVFPAFLFLMGTSLVFSLAARAAKGNCRGTMAKHLFSRTGRLLLLAAVLAFFPRMNWANMRFFGILPRIAICYLLVGLLLLVTRRLRWLGATAAALLVIYWALLRFVPVPHFGPVGHTAGFMDPVDNLASYVDRGIVSFTQRWLYTGALFEHTSDPEGALSTLGSLGTTIFGAMAGVWMRRAVQGRISLAKMRVGLVAAGVALFAAGELWSLAFPINKTLWTSSFALLSAGLVAIVLAVCSWLVDGRSERWPLWLRVTSWPWFVYGSNAIVAYAFSEAIVKIMIYIRTVDADGDVHTAWSRLYDAVFAPNGSTVWTSLAFAAAYTAFCFLPNWALWHRRVFLKI